jgi:hypothetical protein
MISMEVWTTMFLTYIWTLMDNYLYLANFANFWRKIYVFHCIDIMWNDRFLTG